MPTDSNRPDVAVFIDFENVYVSVRDKLDANPNFESIMDRCEDLGRVVIARAYADWYRYPRVTSALYANGIEPMYVPTYYYDRDLGRTGRAIKNSVDMNLCVDVMKTLFTNPNIVKFVLATGDRDFIPLVNTIRQQGKEVIVIGIGGAASAHLAQSADEFIFYESLLGKPPAELLPDQPRTKMPEKGREQYDANDVGASPSAPVSAPPPPAASSQERDSNSDLNIYNVLVDAINLARERGYVCSFGSLKLLMKELMGGEFKESRYKDSSGRPFAKFKDFVMEAERRGKVQVFTNGTVNEVFLPDEDPYKLSQFAQELKEEPATDVPQAAPADEQSEARLLSTNGRNPRRRRRRGQRSTPQQSTEAEETEEPLEVLEESLEPLTPLEIVEPLEELPLDQNASDESEYVSFPELVLPDLFNEPQTDFVFEGLLERIEQEEADRAALEALDPMASMELTSIEAEEQEPQQELPLALPAITIGRPFTEDEHRILREVVAQFERPISFAQIHDALRNARNRMDTGITRTNEELRTLIKQAINSGILQRIGKGNRIAYQLAPQLEVASDSAELDGDAELDQTALIEQTQDDQAETVQDISSQSLSTEQNEDNQPNLMEAVAESDQSGLVESEADQTELAEAVITPEEETSAEQPYDDRPEPAETMPEQAAFTEQLEGDQSEPSEVSVAPEPETWTEPTQADQRESGEVGVAPEQAFEPIQADQRESADDESAGVVNTLPDQVELIEEIVAEQPTSDTLEVVKPSQESITEALVEEPFVAPTEPTQDKTDDSATAVESDQSKPAEKPKRPTRKRKGSTAEATSEPEPQESAKPKRPSRRKKVEDVVEG